MTYPTLKTHRVTWHIDVEAADALEAVRKVASENFQARIAEGYDGTACVFVCECEGHEGQPVTIDLVQRGLDWYWDDTRIITESQKSERLDSDGTKWRVAMPANGEVTITATFETRY